MKPEPHPQIIENNGTKESVVLPYTEYVALREWIEDMEDLLELRDAKTRRRQCGRLSARGNRERAGTVAFGTKLDAPPTWLPVMAFPWWICFGTIVTFFVAILFQTAREHHPGVA